MRIVFFGTPIFAANILEYLIDNNINIVAIVTQAAKGRGKPSAVKQIAEKKAPEKPIFQPEKATDPTFIELIKKLKPDLFIVVAYGKILRQSLLDIPLKDAINIHASILPKYRGAAPIQRALMDGEKKSGITIMEMTRELDAGDIISIKEVQIDENMNFGELHDKLCEVSKPLLLDVIKMYEKGEIKKILQNESLVTYASKIISEDLEIDFNNDAINVHNQIRGLSPYPGARCSIEINGAIKKVKILESKVISLDGTPKQILSFSKDDFTVACKKNAISINKLQIEGKTCVSIADFIRGVKKAVKII